MSDFDGWRCGWFFKKVFGSKRLDEIYKGEKHKYLMMLNKDLIVDATRKGNYARFINHSCDPNCEVQMWYVDGKPRLGIYSRR